MAPGIWDGAHPDLLPVVFFPGHVADGKEEASGGAWLWSWLEVLDANGIQTLVSKCV